MGIAPLPRRPRCVGLTGHVVFAVICVSLDTRAQKLGRKGWVTMFRDSVAFKVAYGWGLRINEVRMLDIVVFGRNPHASRVRPTRPRAGPSRQGHAWFGPEAAIRTDGVWLGRRIRR